MNEIKKYYKYECRTGCGHVTVTDLNTKGGKRKKRVFCSACGNDGTLEIVGERHITESAITLVGISPKLERSIVRNK